jgi:hypothetical protein
MHQGQSVFSRLMEVLPPRVYRQIRRGNPEFWASDGALGKYLPIEPQRVRPRFRFWSFDRIGLPGWQAINFVFVDGDSSLQTSHTGLGLINAHTGNWPG